MTRGVTNNKQAFCDIYTWMLGRWMRPENEERLLWSRRTVRKLKNSSGGFKSTTLWKNPKHFISLFYPPHDSQFGHVCVFAGLLPDGKERQSERCDIGAVREVESLC